MIEALIAGERDPARLADLALRRLRRKTDELQMACDGRFTRSHAQMCRLHLDAYDHLTGQIAELDALVAEAAAPFGRLIARLVTIPGIGRRTGEVIIAETGGDMARFATPARLAAPTRKGDQHLRTAMVESAWATWRTATRPGARFRRLARRFGKGNEKKPPSPSRTPCCASPGPSCTTTATTSMSAPTTTSGATSATASIWSATTSRLWPASACKLSSPSLVTAARRQLQAPRPPPGRLTLTAPHRRATTTGSAGAAARLAGVPEFRHRHARLRSDFRTRLSCESC